MGHPDPGHDQGGEEQQQAHAEARELAEHGERDVP
jgi:hypothetical protein